MINKYFLTKYLFPQAKPAASANEQGEFTVLFIKFIYLLL